MTDAFDALRLECGLSTFLELIDRPAWQADAACREHDLSMFFPVQGQSLEPAREVCASCLVRDECASFALSFSARDLPGVWAGMSPKQRDEQRRSLPDAA